MPTNRYDVIIVGGSYAGMAAAMALGRALRHVLIIDNGNPCNKQTPLSHNFLTNDGKTPKHITALARQQVSQYNTVEFGDGTVTSVAIINNEFTVTANNNKLFNAQKLVLATGIKDIQPDIHGFAACWGISILHCPYCHGYEVRGQKTGILGNGNKGYEFAMLIANWTNDLTLYTNGPCTLDEQQIRNLKKHNIDIVESEILEVTHKNGYLKSIRLKNGSNVPIKILYARLPFTQNTILPQQLGCELTTDGYIKTDATQKTTVKGVFACGDNATPVRTIANAVAMGTTSGIMINKELTEEEF